MARRMLGATGLLAMALALLGACHDVERTRTLRPQAVVEGGPLDFGEVPVGEWREATLQIRNVGFTAVNVREVLAQQANPSFHFEYDPGELPAQSSRRLTVRFHPLAEGPLEERVDVLAGTDEPIPTTAIRGVGSPTPIRIEPSVLDFETLEIESARTLPITITNPVDLPLTVAIEGPSASRFSSDLVTIPPHGSVTLPTHYMPVEEGRSDARLSVRACANCTPTAAGLTGRAVRSAFVFDPSPVPFESTPLHASTRSQTRATNVTWRPVSLVGTRTSDHAFSVPEGPGNVQVEPGASITLPLEFSARASGPTLGRLELDYTSDRPRASDVVLDASGGRPTLALAPVALDLGRVPVGGKVQQEVRLSNAGTTGPIQLLGLTATGAVAQFGVRDLQRGEVIHPWTGTWPALEVPPVSIAPGGDALSLAVFFEPTEVGQFEATIHLHNDDPFTPTRSLTVTGTAYEVGSCRWNLRPTGGLDFGNVPPGWGAVLGFSFENVGEEVCAVKDIELADDGGGAFFMPGGELTGGVVPPGTSFSAMIAFRAPTEGTFNGALTMTVNDPASPRPQLPITGQAHPTCLTAAPNFLDFGPVRYDCEASPRRTLVSNQCAEPVTISGIGIGEGTSDQFGLSEAPAAPLTLQPGEGFELEATYARDVHGQHFSPLFLDVVNEPAPFLIPMLAETNHDDRADETFVQGVPNLLDVLFVVGNTTTMASHQAKLASDVAGWMTDAAGAGLDLRVGVTTTALVPRSGVCTDSVAGGQAGRLVPVDAVRSRITASPDVAALNVRVGACHDLVQGLEAMRQALTPPLVNQSDDPRTPQPADGNLGLLRDPARLAVVVLSDEDDHSGFEPESYLQLLSTLKGPGSSQRTRLHAILPFGGGCSTAAPSADRFAEVARGSGGNTLEICSGSYRSLLDSLTAEAVDVQRAFALTHLPSSEGDIEVSVDGVTSREWRWDPAANAVVFDEAATPAPGQRIRVRYRGVCGTVPVP